MTDWVFSISAKRVANSKQKEKENKHRNNETLTSIKTQSK